MGLFGPSGPEKWKPTNRLTQYFAEARQEGHREPEAEFLPRPLYLDHEAMTAQATQEREQKKGNTRIIAVTAIAVLAIAGMCHEAILEKLSPKDYRVGPKDKQGPTNPSISATPDSVQDLRNSIFEQKEALEAQRLYIEYLRQKNANLVEEVERLGGKAKKSDFKEFLGLPDEEPAHRDPRLRPPLKVQLPAGQRRQE